MGFIERSNYEETTMRGKDAAGHSLSGRGDLEHQWQAVHTVQKPRRHEHGPRTVEGIERIRWAVRKHGRYTKQRYDGDMLGW
jgi:hypothetical protein